jgi:thioredoxin 1
MSARLFKPITDQDFRREVLDSARPVIVYLWAAWSDPCKFFSPALEELAGAHPGKAKLVKVDVDANPQIRKEARIGGLPALLLYKDGQVLQHLIGTTGPAELAELFARAG